MTTAHDTIILPATSITAGDLVDRGFDKVRTVWLALQPANIGWFDDKTLTAISAVLEAAIRDLEPVRHRLHGCPDNVAKGAE